MALTDGLVAYFKMDNNWLDSTGSNDGTATGATFSTTAKLGSHSGNFDGVDDYVTLANEANFDFEHTDPFSMGGWFKTPANTTNLTFLAKREGGGSLLGYDLQLFSTGVVRMIIDSSTGVLIDVRGATTVDDDTWTHIIMTYSGNSAASGVKFYINATEDTYGTQTGASTGTILNTDPFRIGVSGSLAGEYVGLMDEVGIWDRELTSAEITELYNGGVGQAIYATNRGLTTKLTG